ncbi:MULTISPECIES: XRE family transcriptional regulator [Idiomarina]|uniref:XRE family transcriptional regulator n=1 Tax=Idiomarina TaxID=135575 RepID=UPI00129A623C|nr:MULTISPECIES: S24 family peptidase [Idiomarina]MRJ40804.1 helix-turn-helix domain-containing protein [Idiomarina sp. FeN1]NCU56608.1 helix-turn-helix domain-containing protein [Idiomarina sp. FenA--70]NCU58988.1 helix-turn-helix domain-containing protein [Idiomarina sp. FenBw--71]UUN14515.1 helix-turn-helix domain-containing protein [Idiomarina loihiensis]
MQKQSLGERIRRRRKLLGLSQKKLANLLGVTYGNISHWEIGITNPKPSNLSTLAKTLDTTVEWLLDGTEDTDKNSDADYFLDVPPLIHGGGPKYFPRAQLETQNLDLEYLHWLAAPDDSMSPSIREGDVLVVDMHDREVKDGKVYIVRYADALIIKRLFKRINGLLLRSDNTAAVPDETLPPNKQDAIEVVGRVVLRIGEL